MSYIFLVIPNVSECFLMIPTEGRIIDPTVVETIFSTDFDEKYDFLDGFGGKNMNFCPAEHVPPAERHNFMMISGRKSVTKRAYRRPPELSSSVPFGKFRDESNRNDEKARNGQNDAKNLKKT